MSRGIRETVVPAILDNVDGQTLLSIELSVWFFLKFLDNGIQEINSTMKWRNDFVPYAITLSNDTAWGFYILFAKGK